MVVVQQKHLQNRQKGTSVYLSLFEKGDLDIARAPSTKVTVAEVEKHRCTGECYI